VVECQLPKLDVAGSIPVSRSKLLAVPHNTPQRIRGKDNAHYCGSTASETRKSSIGSTGSFFLGSPSTSYTMK
jgi:hypothetical protein